MSEALAKNVELPFRRLEGGKGSERVLIEVKDPKKLEVNLTLGQGKPERVIARVVTDGRDWDAALVLDLGQNRTLTVSEDIRVKGPKHHFESGGKVIPLEE